MVSTLAEYLDWVKSAKQNLSEDRDSAHRKMYFRGQANEKWGLVPALFRPENAQLDEYEMLHQAQLSLWQELQHFHSYWEKMVYLQHYGIPTRLLDVTFNPLLALYMACKPCISNKDGERAHTNGKVFYGNKTNKEYVGTIDITAEFVFQNRTDDVSEKIDRFVKSKPELSKLENVIPYEVFTSSSFVYPPMNNPRVEAQNGAFILAPLIEWPTYESIPTLNKKGLEGTGYFEEEDFAIIDSNAKEDILADLKMLGIDDGTVFCDATHKIKAILEEQRNRHIL